jgi:hypothetical protein
MNFAKRLSMLAGAAVLVAVCASLLAPKATHALVATLVQIGNTRATPVPNSDVDNPARATVVPLTCQAFGDPGDGSLLCNLGLGPNTAYTVPAGQRLVIEQVSAFCQATPSNSIPYANLNLTEAGTNLAVAFALNSKQNDEFVTQSVRYYADPGTSLSFQGSGLPGASFCNYSTSGYLISYP